MIRFKYKAINEKGDLFQDEIEAGSSEEVASHLGAKGYTPVNIAEKLPLPDFSQLLDPSQMMLKMRHVKSREIILFFRQLSALFSAGVPLFDSLQALEEQFAKERMYQTIVKLKDDVAAGTSFSGALSKHSAVFSDLIIAMIEAGERAGVMEDVLIKITAFLEKEDQLKQKVRAALRYPIMVITALTIAFTFAIIFIIPKFTSIFGSFKTQLPLPTRILLGINYAFTNFWWLLLIAGIGGYALFKTYSATPLGRRQVDLVLLKLPVVGLLITKVSLARFFSMLSAMISSGVSVVSGLEITARTADNAIVAQTIGKIREQVIAGMTLSDSMKGHHLFPSTSVRMVAIGEKSGTLEGMLKKTADYFNEESDNTVAGLMSLVEPFLIFFLGMFVLLLAMGIFLPMWSMMQLYSQ
ncbi:hypothetical protein A3H38_03295 [candidate division WOR-1 bacterium RIFCSPLOWO2_02_FULL_46_20]|uniref:Type II secretion system protein GspF domain-containing protein n=2 Tax=Saganbacteria TaxID=1703751 RepID=A0A1F4RG77_UNCSA|nr:MAG: hypothetical protein A3J44_04190 [candidate division WOR-1 bacterium RIFCSPHIGHO2_02_FULL_45_12]OGC07214.1 MAG: hypothetical protein A3H38_03295 [candidate division WOR-1 bacterium RIFCSPLOWO2_02_FULL_46_20]OGC09994.1 MAG: hypothetical protein A3F86_03695 [candidate division WOR-1 bacterium RIFCSPLOWO2_12_FULL_45_9]